MRALRLLLPAIAFLAPVVALAQAMGSPYDVVEMVGGGLPFLMPSGFVCGGNTGCGFVEIAAGVIVRYRPLLTAVGLLNIVIFGYRMIIGQEDEVITKARAMMSGTIAGLIMAYLIEPFIFAFYGSAGEVPQGAMVQGAALVSSEVNGVINWVLVIVASLAVLMLILSAIKAIGQGASDEGIGNMRKTIIGVVFGIILLVFRFVLSNGFVVSTGNNAPLLAMLLRPVSYLLGFLGMISVIVVVYAGFMYVLSMGNEEQGTKAKGLLIRVALGALVILLSLALVNFVILPGLQ